MPKTTRVTLLGGPHHGRRVDLLRITPVIAIRVKPSLGYDYEEYERLDDPDSGEFLGGYVWRDQDACPEVWSGEVGNRWYNGRLA